jgi:hypothetical protein
MMRSAVVLDSNMRSTNATMFTARRPTCAGRLCLPMIPLGWRPLPILNCFVFKMAFAFKRLSVFVFAKDVLVELHIGAKKVLEPGFDALLIFQDFFGDVIRVDINADRTNDSELLSLNGNGRAFEFSRAEVQLVIQFVFVEKLAALEINQQVRCAVA